MAIQEPQNIQFDPTENLITWDGVGSTDFYLRIENSQGQILGTVPWHRQEQIQLKTLRFWRQIQKAGLCKFFLSAIRVVNGLTADTSAEISFDFKVLSRWEMMKYKIGLAGDVIRRNKLITGFILGIHITALVVLCYFLFSHHHSTSSTQTNPSPATPAGEVSEDEEEEIGKPAGTSASTNTPPVVSTPTNSAPTVTSTPTNKPPTAGNTPWFPPMASPPNGDGSVASIPDGIPAYEPTVYAKNSAIIVPNLQKPSASSKERWVTNYVKPGPEGMWFITPQIGWSVQSTVMADEGTYESFVKTGSDWIRLTLQSKITNHVGAYFIRYTGDPRSQPSEGMEVVWRVFPTPTRP